MEQVEEKHDVALCICDKCINARLAEELSREASFEPLVRKLEEMKAVNAAFWERQDKSTESMTRNVQEMKASNAAFQDSTTAVQGRMITLVEDLVSSHKRLRQALVQTETRLEKVADSVKKMKTEGPPDSLQMEIEMGKLRDENTMLKAKLAERAVTTKK